MTARQGWNAAQRASERPLTRRKVHGPVGKRVESNGGPGITTAKREWFGLSELTCCSGCGYHVCSCKPVDPYAHYWELRAKWPNAVVKVNRYARKGDAAMINACLGGGDNGTILFSPQDIPPGELERLRREENERELLKLTEKLAEPTPYNFPVVAGIDHGQTEPTDSGFFIELPKTQVTLLEVPYRNFLITGIAPPDPTFYINIHPETFGLWNAAGTKPLTRQTFQEISDRLCAQSQPTAFQQALDVKLKNIASTFAMYGQQFVFDALDKDHGPK